MARKILWASLALTPVALLARYAFHAGATTLFVLAAAALIPLAWLIGEATENAAEHTGPGIGGFLNASFGNAPELIIAMFAIADGLPNVVLGTLAGSVVSNLLLVLGLAILFGRDNNSKIDARSLRLQLGTILGALVLLLIPSAVLWHGTATPHTLYLVTLPVAAVLLVAYVVITAGNLRKHHQASRDVEPGVAAWPFSHAIALLGVATIATAFISEILVHSLGEFGQAVGLSEFFTAIVIVAIVGNAAEHGSAVVVASRGDMHLATEIAITSSMQVAVFVAPVVALLSWLVGHELALSFRGVELATMAGAALVGVIVVADGRAKRWEGVMLVTAYAAAVIAYALS